MSIQYQAIKGMAWNAVERFSTQGIQFVITIVIARILTPGDYGLVAMLSVFISIAQSFVESGFYNALIQKKDRTEIDYCTMFWFNLAAAVCFYMVLFLSAPLIASFYNQPELTILVRVLGLVLITNSFSIVQQARFSITLNFKKLATASLISVPLGGVIGIVLALQGCGVWTLVFQQLLGSVIWVVSLYVLSFWFPRLAFSWTSFRAMFSYGYKLLFSGLLQTIYLNMYSLVIGKFFNATTLGYYNRAFSLGQFPAQNMMVVIQKVLFPIQCRYQDDTVKFNQIFSIYIRLSSFVLFPLMIGIMVLSAPLVTLLLTEKWLPMVPLLQIICLAMMWHPVMQANVSILDTKGRTDWHLQSEILKKIAAVLILCVTIPRGIQWVCWGMVAYSLMDIAIIVCYSRRLTDIGYWEQFAILFPNLVLSLAMGAVVWLLTSFIGSPLLSLLLGMLIGIVFYFGMAYVLKRPEMEMLITLLKKKQINY